EVPSGVGACERLLPCCKAKSDSGEPEFGARLHAHRRLNPVACDFVWLYGRRITPRKTTRQAMKRTAFDTKLAELRKHQAEGTPPDMRRAFVEDPERFSKFSVSLGGFLLDWSKCAVTPETMKLLVELAASAGVQARRDAMFAGEKINITEDRAVLHVALRAPK